MSPHRVGWGRGIGQAFYGVAQPDLDPQVAFLGAADYFAGSFWTPKTDAQLQRLEAKGFSTAKIAAKLGTTRNSVIGRSQRLRGLYRTFPSDKRRRVVGVRLENGNGCRALEISPGDCSGCCPK
jgi:hypothetical protein